MKSTKSSQATSPSCYPIPASITTNLIHSLDFEIVLLCERSKRRAAQTRTLRVEKVIHAVTHCPGVSSGSCRPVPFRAGFECGGCHETTASWKMARCRSPALADRLRHVCRPSPDTSQRSAAGWTGGAAAWGTFLCHALRFAVHAHSHSPPVSLLGDRRPREGSGRWQGPTG